MQEMNRMDLSFCVQRLPKELVEIMKDPIWDSKVFIGGGYIRAVVAREEMNDVDVFVQSERDADFLAHVLEQRALANNGRKLRKSKSPNAITLIGLRTPLQIIHRWVFPSPEAVIDSFDFTICCAVIGIKEKKWYGMIHPTFYEDLAAKRLVYLKPNRNEDAGGSMLRVLKYYQRGYRIPTDSFGAVIARLCQAVNFDQCGGNYEDKTAPIITGLLRVVDPAIDPLHEAHLPAMNVEQQLEVKPPDSGDDLPF